MRILLLLSACVTLFSGCISPLKTSVQPTSTSAASMKTVIALSRNATTLISSSNGQSRGTGFLIGRRHIVTCFHVVAEVVQNGNNIKFNIHNDTMVKLSTGLEVKAKVVSVPSSSFIDPIVYDYAVLELQQEIPKDLQTAILEVGDPVFEIGDDVYFSGYPLATPAMVTHKGMISGFSENSSIICIQGAINKGNSGGGLCSSDGKVIGIVSMREGGIAQGLQQLNNHIEETRKHGGVSLMGVDPLQAIRGISLTLDKYISTGIGYARSSTFLKAYLDSHPDLLK